MNAKSKISISAIISDNQWFFLAYTLFFISGLFLIVFVPKGDIILLLNRNRSDFFDFFFRFITLLGDGFFLIIIFLILLVIRIRFALLSFLSFAFSGIFTQIAKHIFSIPRPKSFFAPGILHFIEGVKVYSSNSFPSGHSATAFAFFLMLALILKNKKLGIVCFLLALTVGISRIYTLQHFFIDVYFGSLIGVIFSILTFYFITNSKRIGELEILEKSLITVFKKK